MSNAITMQRKTSDGYVVCSCCGKVLDAGVAYVKEQVEFCDFEICMNCKMKENERNDRISIAFLVAACLLVVTAMFAVISSAICGW